MYCHKSILFSKEYQQLVQPIRAYQDSIHRQYCQGPVAGLSGKTGALQCEGMCRRGVGREPVLFEHGRCPGPAEKSQKKWDSAEIPLQCPVVINSNSHGGMCRYSCSSVRLQTRIFVQVCVKPLNNCFHGTGGENALISCNRRQLR